jgi:hypothetical protein
MMGKNQQAGYPLEPVYPCNPSAVLLCHSYPPALLFFHENKQPAGD